MAWQGRGAAILVVVGTVSGMVMMNPAPVQGQAVIPSTPTPKAVAGPATNIIPSITLSERYDSNVYFISGGPFEDYVTRVSPQVRVVHMRQLIEARVGGGLTSELYVKNPGLNYVGANGAINLNLDGAMNRLVRGLGLQISDIFQYTPQPPAFIGSTQGDELPESVVIGVQARRANSTTNAGTVAASYWVSPRLSFNSTYKDLRRQFGNATPVPPTGEIQQTSLIDITFQTVTSGLALNVSPIHTVTLSHQYQHGTFDQQGTKNDFSTQGAIAGWTSPFTPTLTASVTGGFAVFATTNDLQYVGSASLLWKGEHTDLTLSYRRMIAPSFFVAATPLLSQVVTATATHHVTEPFSVSLSGNYAHSESIPDSSLLKFESYSVMPSMQYRVNQVMTATLSYAFYTLDRTTSSQTSSFDRNIVMLRIFAEWE